MVLQRSHSPNANPKNVYNREMTALEKHCAFFDRNKDGILMPWETFQGFRALGFNLLLSLFGTFVIHLFFSYPTLDTWIPDPFFAIYLHNIHRCTHGSDTASYDHEGNVVNEQLHGLLARFDRNGKGGIGFWEGIQMLAHVRDVADPFGWFAAMLEWGFLWILAAQDGKVSHEAIKAQYDGSLFYSIESARRAAEPAGPSTPRYSASSSLLNSPSVSGYPASPLVGKAVVDSKKNQ